MIASFFFFFFMLSATVNFRVMLWIFIGCVSYTHLFDAWTENPRPKSPSACQTKTNGSKQGCRGGRFIPQRSTEKWNWSHPKPTRRLPCPSRNNWFFSQTSLQAAQEIVPEPIYSTCDSLCSLLNCICSRLTLLLLITFVTVHCCHHLGSK